MHSTMDLCTLQMNFCARTLKVLPVGTQTGKIPSLPGSPAALPNSSLFKKMHPRRVQQKLSGKALDKFYVTHIIIYGNYL